MNLELKRKIKRLISTKQRVQIAKDLKLTKNYVSMVLNGTRNNAAVWEMAIAMVKTAKEKENELLKLVENDSIS